MKKALQFPYLRAESSVSERAAVRGSGETQRSRPRDLLAELLALDRGGQRGRFGESFRGRCGSRGTHRPGGHGGRLRKMSLGEPERLRRMLSQLTGQPLQDPRCHLAELER